MMVDRLVPMLLALIMGTFSCFSARADELNGGQLYAFCTSSDEVASTACRFFVLGAVTGIGLGDGSTRPAGGRTYVERKKTHFCIPDEMPQSDMVDVFVQTVRLLVMKYPEDIKLPAVSLVDAAMQRRFPCPK
jgi:Rap1a immunity proteins